MSSLEVEILIVNSTLSTVPVLSLIGCWKDDTLAFQHSAVSWGNCLPKLYQITCFKPQGRNGTPLEAIFSHRYLLARCCLQMKRLAPVGV